MCADTSIHVSSYYYTTTYYYVRVLKAEMRLGERAWRESLERELGERELGDSHMRLQRQCSDMALHTCFLEGGMRRMRLRRKCSPLSDCLFEHMRRIRPSWKGGRTACVAYVLLVQPHASNTSPPLKQKSPHTASYIDAPPPVNSALIEA